MLFLKPDFLHLEGGVNTNKKTKLSKPLFSKGPLHERETTVEVYLGGALLILNATYFTPSFVKLFVIAGTTHVKPATCFACRVVIHNSVTG